MPSEVPMSEMAKRRAVLAMKAQQKEIAGILVAAMVKLKVKELRLRESDFLNDIELVSFFDDRTGEQVYALQRKSKP